MTPVIRSKALVTTVDDRDVFIEAWKPEGIDAYVHLVQVQGLPRIDLPALPPLPSLEEALDAGIGYVRALLAH